MIALSERANKQSSAGDTVDRVVTLQDCLFLSLVVLLSFILYVTDLGFYRDDWGFLRLLVTAGNESFQEYYRALYAGDIVLRQRPVQMLLLSGLYWLFGLQPLGYHLFNSTVLLLSVVLFYLVLRELKQPRLLALSIPLVYALLPHYSTDRFWIAAYQATLSILLYFLSFYADLRALQARSIQFFCGWRAAALLSLIGSVLAYEVVLPLFLLNSALFTYWIRLLNSPLQSKQRRARLTFLLGSNLLALLVVIGFKLATSVRVGIDTDLLSHLINLVVGAVRVNYGAYGLGLPYIIWWIMRHDPNWLILASGGALGLIVFAYLHYVTRRPEDVWPGKTTWLKYVALGLVVFGLGFAIFLFNADVWFTSAGQGNRVAIAAALGVAMSFVGGIGWVTSLLPVARYRRHLFSLLVAFLALSGFLINNTLATFWISAYQQQQAILKDIHEHLPLLPAGSTLILDGTCPEVGPAPVFQSAKDLAGALVISYGDPSLYAIAVTPDLTIGETGIIMRSLSGKDYGTYPYTERLLLYNYEQKLIYRLVDAGAAHSYFELLRPEHPCPPGFAWGWNTR